jgi:hypothetical protein
MSMHFVAALACRFRILVAPFLFLLSIPIHPAAGQVSLSVQGGVHAARLGRPERAVLDPGGGIALQGGNGEASALGLRVGYWLSRRWGIDGGIVKSRNLAWNGSAPFGLLAEQFETRIVFTSATFRARLSAPQSRWGLSVGTGPALIFHEGSGTSLLTRNTDIGGLIDIAGSLGVSSRLALTLNLHQYLFSSSFAEPYEGQFVGDPIQPAGSRFRHEFVILAGLTWRVH